MKPPRIAPFVLTAVFTTSLAFAQISGIYGASSSLPIPPSGSGGAAGGCSPGSPNVTELTVDVPDAFMLSYVSVALTLTHTYVGDLTLTLSHCGTSVELYDRTPSSSSNLSGTYTFNDLASQAFAASVSTPSLVPPGTYLPVNPLSAFYGTSSGGVWRIAICDQAGGDVGVLTSIVLVLGGAQTWGGLISPPEPIPDGNGNCVSPVVRAINVGTPGIVDDVVVTLNLTHTFVDDLDISIAHDGVVAVLTQAGTMAGGIGVQGNYTFSDEALTTFAAATYAAPPSTNLANATYQPKSPLSAFNGHSKAGVWLVTICDKALADVGWISYATITQSDSAWDFSLAQPGGAAFLLFMNVGGAPGNTYLNLATVVPGGFPNGWLNGLDISIPDILAEVSLGPPVIGTLGACGSAITALSGPFPPGLPIQFVSFELDASGAPVASKHAFQYVTQ